MIRRKDKYLVTRRSASNDYKPLKWDIPGGVAKVGETLEDTIFREVCEETKLTIHIDDVIFVYSNRDQLPVRQTFQVVYLCRLERGKIRLNPVEHDAYQWLSYEDIANLDTIDFLRELIKSCSPTDWKVQCKD